jgi:exosortase
LFFVTLRQLVELWSRDPNYNHGFLVLPITGWLLIRAFRRAGPVGAPNRRLGWFALMLGAVAHLTAILFALPLVDFLALLFVARGGLLFVGGLKWAGAFTFPLAFTVFLFPLPPMLLSTVALWLQDIAARVSETVLGLFVVCTRNGHTIRIAGMDGSLVVAEECSGTRQIVAFVALAALFGHLSNRSTLYRVFLLVSSIPVAITANVLRVVLMNLGAYWFGTKWLGGWLHDAPALFSLPVGLVLFFAIDRVLTRLFSSEESKASAEAVATTDRPTLPADFARRWLVPTAVCVGLIAASVGFAWHLTAGEANSYPMAAAPLADLPFAFPPTADGVPGWRGGDLDEEKEALKKKLAFQVDDLFYRAYQTTDRSVGVTAYILHSRTGDDRKHHPEVCIGDVSGAPEERSARRRVPLSADGREAQRLVYQTGGNAATMVYYWHYTFLPSTRPASPFQALHQQIGVPPPSITCTLYTRYDERSARLVEGTLLPQLDAEMRKRVLPPDARVGCDRLPVLFVR